MSECSYGSSPGNSGRLQITGGGEWLDSSPPCRIFITSNDLLSIGLPLSCLRGTAPPACLPSVPFLLSSPGSLSSVSPVASPHSPDHWWHGEASLADQTLGQLDPTTRNNQRSNQSQSNSISARNPPGRSYYSVLASLAINPPE